MELITILLLVFTIAYLILISSFCLGLNKLLYPREDTPIYIKSISVVIPFRNEEESLPFLLTALARQEGVNADLSFILSDDHSTDRSGALANDFASRDERFIYLAPEEECSGKKAALKRAVEHARGEWIIQLDADVKIGSRFISTYLNAINRKAPGLISGPVAVRPVASLLNGLEALEFMSLNASGAGSFGTGMPIMCNGANLAFSKAAWLEALSNGAGNKSPSGDDMFLMHAFKKNRLKMVFLLSKEAVADIAPAKSMRDLFLQRLRWSSKSTAYRDTQTILTALIVYLTSLFFLLALTMTVTGQLSVYFTAAAFIAKTAIDLCLLSTYSKMTGQQYLLRYFAPLVLIHYFYIVLIPLLSLFIPYNWKGRVYKGIS